MEQVTGAQGREIHSWALHFPELKREYHELVHTQARMLGGGKLNLHMPLPVSAFFTFTALFYVT